MTTWPANGHPGSSPRGRGKHHGGIPTRGGAGLIPAWAGKTSGYWIDRRQARAHPRVGGENQTPAGNYPRGWGSSPRGRGKHVGARVLTEVQRLIPAWAGKTVTLDADAASETAHPRVGGENRSRALRRTHSRGSSPRGRGKQFHDLRHTGLTRLIPAWAGKTPASAPPMTAQGAHPRVGGENTPPAGALVCVTGSSPRGRGKRRDRHGGAGQRRLIPAWAGKTRTLRQAPPLRQAHPRVGGENRRERQTRSNCAGSSPRGRGKQGPSRVP